MYNQQDQGHQKNPNNFVSRRMIRIRVMQGLYAFYLNETDPTEVFDILMKDYLEDIRKLERRRGDHGDSQFLLALYFETINNKDAYDQYIISKAANWELDRIALVDRILLQMGICEILNFEEIPVKVTINEYLEIAKKFSTPKSSKFINGILDSLYLEWKDSGTLNKTGRGLIEFTTPKKPPVRRPRIGGSGDSGGYNRNEGSGGFNRNEGSGGYNRNEGSGGYNRNQGSGRYNRNEGSGGFNRNEGSGGWNRNDNDQDNF